MARPASSDEAGHRGREEDHRRVPAPERAREALRGTAVPRLQDARHVNLCPAVRHRALPRRHLRIPSVLPGRSSPGTD